MSGSKRAKVATVAALAVAALLAVVLLAVGPGPGAPGAARGPWAVTRDAFSRLWSGALEAFGLRTEATEAGAEPASDDQEDAEPKAGPPAAEPRRGGGTDPDG